MSDGGLSRRGSVSAGSSRLVEGDALQIEPGTKIGHYEVLELLGDGGMCQVWLLRHVYLYSLYALKVPKAQYRHDKEFLDRFFVEARILAALSHYYLVSVNVIIEEPPGLVMTFLQGPTLAEFLRRDEHRQGLPTQLLLDILLPVLGAMDYAHRQGVVHRDLKPSNIILTKRPGTDLLRPVVFDFGIASVQEGSRVPVGRKCRSDDASLRGTPNYMSPEQISGQQDLDASVDIFALGAVLYELATGRRAFGGATQYQISRRIMEGDYPPPRDLVPSLHPLIEACIHRALQVQRHERFASCGAFRDALAEARKESPILQSGLGEGIPEGTGPADRPGPTLSPPPPAPPPPPGISPARAPEPAPQRRQEPPAPIVSAAEPAAPPAEVVDGPSPVRAATQPPSVAPLDGGGEAVEAASKLPPTPPPDESDFDDDPPTVVTTVPFRVKPPSASSPSPEDEVELSDPEGVSLPAPEEFDDDPITVRIQRAQERASSASPGKKASSKVAPPSKPRPVRATPAPTVASPTPTVRPTPKRTRGKKAVAPAQPRGDAKRCPFCYVLTPTTIRTCQHCGAWLGPAPRVILDARKRVVHRDELERDQVVLRVEVWRERHLQQIALFGPGIARIGRGRACGLELPHLASVAANHARLLVSESASTIIARSKNAQLKVGGQDVQTLEIKPESRCDIGVFELRFFPQHGVGFGEDALA